MRAAADLRLRPRGHWDRHSTTLRHQNYVTLVSFFLLPPCIVFGAIVVGVNVVFIVIKLACSDYNADVLHANMLLPFLGALHK
jgi:hypothetical protein